MYKTLAPIVVFALVTLFSSTAFAADPIEGEWIKDSKSARIKLKVTRKGTLMGMITYVKDPKRTHDTNNPDPSKHKRKLVGLVIVRGFTKDGDTWTGGTVYDSHSGKTYKGKIWLENGKLMMRGYIGVSLIGRTATWTRYK
ncbi:SIGNAL peptide protein, partial [bacterium DOLZORAL124_64_63]